METKIKVDKNGKTFKERERELWHHYCCANCYRVSLELLEEEFEKL